MRFAALLPLLVAVAPAEAQLTHVSPELLRCVHAHSDINACFKFSRRQRMHGIWLREMEGSWYFDGPTGPRHRLVLDEKSTWLDLKPVKMSGPSSDGETRTFLIVFEGRKSLEPGFFGGGGVASNTVLVDRLISMRPIPLPRITRYFGRAPAPHRRERRKP